jgi:hypothetical protein
VSEYEGKLDGYRKMEKELSKRIKMKEDGEFKVVEAELRSKVKHFESLLQQTSS